MHVGAGSGYYTTILATLVGETGSVDAYEIEPELARRASANLAPIPQARVHFRFGVTEPLPSCDVIYVNAGATEPMAAWLDALRPGGRLLFPLTPSTGVGAMLLITKGAEEPYAARFLMQVQFVPCVGARNESTANKLSKAFQSSNWDKVKSLYRNNAPDRSCWCSGLGWWLSTN